MIKLSELPHVHRQAVEKMKGQLLIALIKRLGGSVDIPVDELNGTGKYNVAVKLVDRVFHFEVVEK